MAGQVPLQRTPASSELSTLDVSRAPEIRVKPQLVLGGPGSAHSRQPEGWVPREVAWVRLNAEMI